MLEHDSDDQPRGSVPGQPAGPGPLAPPDCREALDTLYRFLDGELDDGRRRIIAEHLARCSPCLGAYDFEAELKVVIASRCRESVPEGLLARVASAIAEASRSFHGAEDRA